MKYLFLLMLLPVTSQMVAQAPKSLTGSVISSENRLPVPGVTVKIGTNDKPTITDGNGFFRIKYTPGDFINITASEFHSKVILTDTLQTSYLEIVLEYNPKTLAPVVINTGYQKIGLGKTTGSYVLADSNMFSRSTSSNILNRLDAVVPSLYFDKRDNTIAPLQIRGISTLGYAPTTPLIILNNFPYDGELKDINPDDVESVTILRDAAAYAIWGARAGNGVVVITTKRGSQNERLQINFHAAVTSGAKPHLHNLNAIPTKDFITVEKFLFEKGFYDYLFLPGYYQPVSPVVSILNDIREGRISSSDAEKEITALEGYDVRNDFEKYLLRNSFSQQYHLSASTGSQYSNHYFSLGYNNEETNLIRDNNNSVAASLSNSFKVMKKLHISADFLFSRRIISNNNTYTYENAGILGTGQGLYPYARLADDGGNPMVLDAYFRSDFIDTAGAGMLLDWKFRPLDDISYINNTTKTSMINSTLGINYKIFPFLHIDLKYQYGITQYENNHIRYLESFEARNWINLFSQNQNGSIKYIVPIGGIKDSRYETAMTNNFRAQINLDKDFALLHSLNISGGFEARSNVNNWASYKNYGYNNNMSVVQVDHTTTYPTYNNVFGKIYIPSSNSLGRTKDNFVSAFLLGNFSYKNFLFISGSYRYDASNLFGVETNKKGVPLWSLGSGLTVSSLRNYNVSYLPYLKVRLTYDYGGNVSKSIAALTTLSYSTVSQPLTNLPYASIKSFPNPNLRWEKVVTTNLGIDFRIQEWLTGSIDAFNKSSLDVLYPQDMDPTLGLLSLVYNSANLKSRGVDLTLSSRNITGQQFKWLSIFNFSYVKTKITKVLKSPSTTAGFTSNGLNLMPLAGYEPFQIVSHLWAGLDNNGHPQGWLNGRKSINYDSLNRKPFEEQKINGSAVPHAFGNLVNEWRIDRFTLSANVYFRLGYFFRKPSLDYYELFYSGHGINEFTQRWKKEGDEQKTTIPSMAYPYNSGREQFYKNADINVLPGDYIRLRDIKLSYSPSMGNRSFMTSLQLYCILTDLDLFLWRSNKYGVDPDFPNGKSQGITTTLGIKINF